MKIAVTYKNDRVFQHFGRTPYFKVYEVENGAIKDTKVVDTEGSGHGALAGLLRKMDVDTLICGGIGGGACSALEKAGIRLYGGVTGNADDAVNALLKEKLVYDPNVMCNHHGEGHGGECGHGHGQECGHGHGHGQGQGQGQGGQCGHGGHREHRSSQ